MGSGVRVGLGLGERAAHAVAQEDGAGARPHDDAAVDAVVDLHLVRVRVRVRVRVKVRVRVRVRARVKTTTAAGTCRVMSSTIARRFWRFSCAELERSHGKHGRSSQS